MQTTGWILALLAVGIGASFYVWRALRPLEQVEKVLAEIEAGKRPSTFLLPGPARMLPLALALERVSDAQQRLQREVLQEKLTLQAVLASMQEGLMVLDETQVIRLANPSLCQMFELKNDPVGRTVLATIRDVAVEALIASVVEKGNPQAREIAVTSRSFNRHLAATAVPLDGGSAQRRGVLVIFDDVTRLKQLEEARRDLVANVSHELRTPLSIFQGHLENLLDQPDLPRDELVRVLGILKKHSFRLNALIEDLLTLARLESGTQPLELQPLEIEPLLRELAEDWVPKIAQTGMALAVEASPDLPPVPADRFRLEQVLNNLIENALQYTNPGGRVIIRATVDDGHLVVQVSDDGIGIAPADLPHIFTRFYRADKARSRERGGTGLGLAIVKHIIQLHGGTVAAESNLGKGTTIRLSFPLREP